MKKMKLRYVYIHWIWNEDWEFSLFSFLAQDRYFNMAHCRVCTSWGKHTIQTHHIMPLYHDKEKGPVTCLKYCVIINTMFLLGYNHMWLIFMIKFRGKEGVNNVGNDFIINRRRFAKPAQLFTILHMICTYILFLDGCFGSCPLIPAGMVSSQSLPFAALQKNGSL